MCSEIDVFGLFTISGYGIMIAVGVICLASYITWTCRRNKLPEKLLDKAIFVTALCGIGMYLSASFFDNLWHSIAYYQQYGTWKWIEYGITFSGGLVGAIVVFFIAYFIIFKKQAYMFNFFMNTLIVGVIVTHAWGRIGCFMAGCCYGQPTNAWYGVSFPDSGGPVVPIMLFEAGYLFIVFILMVLFVKRHHMRYYLIAYNVWRFIIEFYRGDDRGGSILGLTPSQFLGVIMILFAVVLFIFEDKWVEKLKKKYIAEHPGEKIYDFYGHIPQGFIHDFGLPNFKAVDYVEISENQTEAQYNTDPERKINDLDL